MVFGSADGWVTLAGNYSFTQNNVTGIIMYVESASATASYYIDTFSLTQTAPPPLAFDFEDGTTGPFFPFGSPTLANSTDVALTVLTPCRLDALLTGAALALAVREVGIGRVARRARTRF